MKITIEISDDDAVHISKLLDLMALNGGEHNSHGTLTIKSLAEMLMQDVALAHRRPESWEGANMTDVLTSHGYEV
jgi:hypothetical protein